MNKTTQERIEEIMEVVSTYYEPKYVDTKYTLEKMLKLMLETLPEITKLEQLQSK